MTTTSTAAASVSLPRTSTPFSLLARQEWLRAMRSCAPLLPFLMTLGVVALWSFLDAALGLAEFPLERAAACRSPWRPATVGPMARWASALFVCSSLTLLVLVTAIRGIVLAQVRRRHILALGACALALILGQAAHPSLIASPRTWQMIGVLRQGETMAGGVFVAFLLTVNITDLAVAAALCAMLWRASLPPVQLRAIAETRAMVHDLLVLATVWMVTGIIELGLLPGVVMDDLVASSGRALNTVMPSLTLWAGVLYSAMLAALFLPAELILRGVALRTQPGERANGQRREKWLSDHGLDLSVPILLTKVGAIFAPLLAGVLQDIAKLAFPS